MSKGTIQQTTKIRNKKGFTLVELIVVLVILAILIAIGIFAFTGYIDKANEKKAITECRQCVVAAQTMASEKHGTSNRLTNDTIKSEENLNAIVKLAEVEDLGRITTITLENAVEGTDGNSTINKLVWASNTGYVVTYENKKYTVSKKEAAGLSADNSPWKTFIEAIQGLKWYNAIDSGATNIEGSNAQKISGDLSDLANMNVKSWAVRNETGNVVTYWWSDQNLTGYKTGDWVKVIRYNPKNETYTVAYAKLQEKTMNETAYLTYPDSVGGSGWKEIDGQTADTKKNYSEAVAIFNAAPATKQN